MRISKLLLLLGALGLTAITWSLFSTGGGGSRPNILLISIDSLRQDMVGAYGFESPYARGVSSSPALDELAAGGLVFDNAHSTTSWTLPSHMTLLTGVPEILHGVDIDYHKADPSRRLVSEYLQDAGYRTAGFFSGPYLDPMFGFGRGFDRFEACYGPDLAGASRAKAKVEADIERKRKGASGLPSISELARLANETSIAQEHASHNDVSSPTVCDAAIAELQSAAQAGEPFFLFAHLFDPHYDYVPPAPFDQQFDGEYDGPVSGVDFLTNPLISKQATNAPRPGMYEQVASQRDMEHIRALYAGELAWVDSQVARILAKLDELGLRDNTIVIVTSDHGDEFFEHGSLGHRNTLYEEITRVPLIVSWPAEIKVPRRMSALVSNVDLAPTILDWVGVSADMYGTSVAPMVAGKRDLRPRHIIGRMVRTYPIRTQAPGPNGAPQDLAGKLVTVTESFHHETIKIIRERSWPQLSQSALERMSPAAALDFENQRNASFKGETLRWIDLAYDPTERPENFSTDFTLPPAVAALGAFRDVYLTLNEERSDALEGTTDTSGMRDMLAGLGYLDGESAEVYPHGEFSLPAPQLPKRQQ